LLGDRFSDSAHTEIIDVNKRQTFQSFALLRFLPGLFMEETQAPSARLLVMVRRMLCHRSDSIILSEQFSVFAATEQ
jgi:hypothetical protein